MSFCSEECRQRDKQGGPRLADLLASATDPRVYAQVALLLVTIDLRLRGFHVLSDPMLAGSQLMVADDCTGLWLQVISISSTGYFPPLDTYDCVAAVYRDGRIQYGGKNPLVPEPELIKDASKSENL